MTISDWVAVIPTREAVKETARALLALAHSPHDVRTAGTGNEFWVPPYLADLYNASLAPKPRRRNKSENKEEGED